MFVGVTLCGVAGCASHTGTPSPAPATHTPSSARTPLAVPRSARQAADEKRSPLPTCGQSPVSTRAWASKLKLTLSAPRSARPAQVVRPTATIVSRGTRYRVDADLPVDVLIVSSGKIVGLFNGASAGTGFPGPFVTAKPRTIDAAAVLMRGCPTGPADLASSSVPRPPLRPGIYSLVAVLHGEGASAGQTLVSAPMAITVTQ